MSTMQTGLQLSVKGTLLNSPFNCAFSNGNSGLNYIAYISLKEQSLYTLVKEFDKSYDINDEYIVKYIDNVFGSISADIAVIKKQYLEVRLCTETAAISVISGNNGRAVLIKINDETLSIGDEGSILSQVFTIRKYFCLNDLYLFYSNGTGITVSNFSSFALSNKQIPSVVANYSSFIQGTFNFTGNPFLKSLFGDTNLDLFLGYSKVNKSFAALVTIPNMSSNYLSFKNMYMQILLGEQVAFELNGSFVFNSGFDFLKNVSFTIASKITPGGFLISGQMDGSLLITDVLQLNNVCVIIGFQSTGVTFGLISSLSIRSLSFYSAFLLTCQGPSVIPQMLCAAFNNLSISDLFVNISGYTINGIEDIDVVSIGSFNIQQNVPFKISDFETKDLNAISASFNKNVPGQLALTAENIRIYKFNNGYVLSDMKNMRQYTVDNNGNISLDAQFYYSTGLVKDVGAYTTDAGIFICAVLKIKAFGCTVIMSFRTETGLLAYASADPIVLPFLSITASGAENDPFTALDNTVIKTFVNEKDNGLNFFLSVSKREISFYYDGKINIFNGLIVADVRLLYVKRRLSIYTAIQLFGFSACLKVDADFNDFFSGTFSFYFSCTTAGLEQKFKTVTNYLDTALENLREKILDTQQAIDLAQQNVNNLNNQIDYYRSKIAECHRDIDNADFFSKVIVTIQKYAEITMYESAIAAINAAVAIASVTLDIAKEVMNFTGALSTDILNLIKSAVSSISSLLMIQSLELSAAAEKGGVDFSAEITFVALGKSYHLSTSFKKDNLLNDAVSSISQSIIGLLKPDVDALENNGVKPLLKSMNAHSPSDHDKTKKRLANAAVELEKAKSLIDYMISDYQFEFGEELSKSTHIQQSYFTAMESMKAALGKIEHIASIRELSLAIEKIKKLPQNIRITKAQSVKTRTFKESTEKSFDQINSLYTEVQKTIVSVSKIEMKLRKPTGVKIIRVEANKPAGNIKDYLLRLESEIDNRFDKTVDTGFMNPALEQKLKGFVDDALAAAGYTSDTGRKFRSSPESVVPEWYIPRL